MRILGVAVAGYLTAALAVFLIGRPASGTELTEGEVAQLRREIEALRREIARLSGGR
jgi:hypothetical protein